MSGRPGQRVAPRGATTEERLAFHSVNAPSGCRIWLGARSGPGYGRIQVARHCMYAHRVSYETHVGPIPVGYQLDHLCRRPACIRPEHLQAVPPVLNVGRGTSPGARARRRDKCLAGHPYAEHGKILAGGPNGRRICRTCANERVHQWRIANRDDTAKRQPRMDCPACGRDTTISKDEAWGGLRLRLHRDALGDRCRLSGVSLVDIAPLERAA